jgi:hypothetical protein
MSNRVSLWFWSTTLVLGLALLGGCQHQPESSEAGEGAASSDAASQPESAPNASPATPGDSRSAAPAAAPAAPAPRQVTLPAGTTVKVRTTNTLSTKTVQSGETFTASLEEPIVDGTWVVAEKGATVYGKVVNADAGGRVKGVASLTVRLTELQTADGQRIAINTDTRGAQAKSSKKKDATKVGIAAGVGAAIGAIAGGGSGAAKGAGIGAGAGTGVVLATHGDPAVIPSESVLTFTLSEPLTITEK